MKISTSEAIYALLESENSIIQAISFLQSHSDVNQLACTDPRVSTLTTRYQEEIDQVNFVCSSQPATTHEPTQIEAANSEEEDAILRKEANPTTSAMTPFIHQYNLIKKAVDGRPSQIGEDTLPSSILRGDIPRVIEMVKGGEKEKMNELDQYGNPALYYASAMGQSELADYLIWIGAKDTGNKRCWDAALNQDTRNVLSKHGISAKAQ